MLPAITGLLTLTGPLLAGGLSKGIYKLSRNITKMAGTGLENQHLISNVAAEASRAATIGFIPMSNMYNAWQEYRNNSKKITQELQELANVDPDYASNELITAKYKNLRKMLAHDMRDSLIDAAAFIPMGYVSYMNGKQDYKARNDAFSIEKNEAAKKSGN